MTRIYQYYGGYYQASGGVETHITDIVRFLDYDFDIITDAFPGYLLTEKFGENTVVRRFKPYNNSIIPTKNIRNSKPLFLYRVLTDALRINNKRRYLSNANFDLLHVHGANLGNAVMRLCFMLNTLAPFRRFIDFSFVKKPTILTLHGLGTLISERPIIEEFERSFIDQFTNIICVDKNIYTCVNKNYNEDKDKNVWYIPNSVDTKKFYFTNISNDRKLKIGFIGRLEKTRGISLLIDLIKNLPPFIELYVVGAGNALDIDRFKRSINTSRIHFYTNIEHRQIQDFYRKIDILFNPVIVEGVSRVTLEAMACGRPVIMIDKGDRYPIVHQQTGFLIKNQINPLLFLLNYLSENRNEIQKAGKKARKVVENEFDSKSIVPIIGEVFESLLED